MSNTRVHQDAFVPIGDDTTVTTAGASSLSVPSGASGVMLQSSVNYAYVSFTDALADASEGFLLPTGVAPQLFWFDPTEVTTIYLYGGAGSGNDRIRYMFVAPKGGQR